jgi:deoxyribodipyrimidine photo-lyase
MRIFNPRLQSERHDPRGEYIIRHIPELAGVPLRYLHAPHEMPLPLQKEVGCVIGRDYPWPIVDHASAAGEYRRMFAAVRSSRK